MLTITSKSPYAVRALAELARTGSAGPVGTLVVADRSGDVRPFGPEDLQLFSTIASHAGVSLENSDDPEVKGFWIRDGKIDESELAIG